MVKVSVILPFHGRGEGGCPIVWDLVDSTGSFNNGDIVMSLDGLVHTSVISAFESCVAERVTAQPRAFDFHMAYKFEMHGVIILWWVSRIG